MSFEPLYWLIDQHNLLRSRIQRRLNCLAAFECFIILWNAKKYYVTIASSDGIEKKLRAHQCQIFYDSHSPIRIVMQETNSLKSETFIDPKSEAPRNGLRKDSSLNSMQRCSQFDEAVFAVFLHSYEDNIEGTGDVDIALF